LEQREDRRRVEDVAFGAIGFCGFVDTTIPCDIFSRSLRCAAIFRKGFLTLFVFSSAGAFPDHEPKPESNFFQVHQPGGSCPVLRFGVLRVVTGFEPRMRGATLD
jgi:hypothetical protein